MFCFCSSSVRSPDQKWLDCNGDAVFLYSHSVWQFIHSELILDGRKGERGGTRCFPFFLAVFFLSTLSSFTPATQAIFQRYKVTSNKRKLKRTDLWGRNTPKRESKLKMYKVSYLWARLKTLSKEVPMSFVFFIFW